MVNIIIKELQMVFWTSNVNIAMETWKILERKI